jgi:protein O-GlcNAc transferase
MKGPTVHDAFQAGLQHHQAGRFEQAESLYRLALENDPKNADVLHILGVLLHQSGRNAESIDLLRRAIEINPAVPDFHNNLGNVLRAWNRVDEAVIEFRAALAIHNEYVEAHANLGSALHDQGKFDEAIEAYAAALRLRSDVPEIYNNLGITLQTKGDAPRAVDAFREAIRLKPDFVEAHHNLASALQASGQLDAAENQFSIAVRQAPEFHEARLHLANLLHSRGKIEPAEAQLRKLIELNPQYVPAYNNLANVLIDMGRADEAIRVSEKAIEIQPNLPQPHVSLGKALQLAGRVDDAIGCFHNAMSLRPEDAAIHDHLGSALLDAGLVQEAIGEFGVAVQMQPAFVRADDHRLVALHLHPDYNAQRLDEEHRAWARRHADPLHGQIPAHANDRSPERPLRIGYVSPDFREHPTGRFLLPLFASHNRNQFHLIAYSDVRTADGVTKELQSHTDEWHEVRGMADAKLVELIRSHSVDVLVDLSLHGPGNRMLTFARKPAPVQITCLGYPSTTGLNTVDYRITDTTIGSSIEKDLLVPGYFCYRPPVGAPEVGELPALSAGHSRFACLEHVSKISAVTLKLWREILDNVANSTLALSVPDGQARGRIIEAIGDSRRIEFSNWSPFPDYLRALNRVDIALDTVPFNASVMTCDALWMGVPVITLTGETSVGRAGASILSSAGVPELIAQSSEQYVQIARELAEDRKKLSALRSSLRTQLSRSRLCDALSYTRDLEAAYRTAWRQWCKLD